MDIDINSYLFKAIDFNKNKNFEYNQNRVIVYGENENSLFCLSYDNFQNDIANIELITNKECIVSIISEDDFSDISTKLRCSNENKFELIKIDTNNVDNIKVINYLNSLIDEAIKRKVSDIHIEPLSNDIRIRFRIDGKLLVRDIIDKSSFYNIIVTRIKVLTKLDISEKRLPQDGRITFMYEDREIDLRVSIIPTINGEKIVLRILDSVSNNILINNLGISSLDIEYILTQSKKLNGMILVVGPTGSGKTTTLYSLLKEIYTDELNVTTLEDPVEYKNEDFNQIQVNYRQGLNFSNTLKNILRQDPDIIIVGELRDSETVETALRASITGHLVASTLHTQDAISTIFRLKDMGSKSYLISQSLNFIISERLVRKLCPYCKAKSEDSFEDIKPFEHFKAVGCDKCNNGYIGRIGAFEVLKIDSGIKDLISDDSSYDEILNYALKNGFIPIKKALKQLVIDGVTSLDEILIYI